jgi:hypothetical protein
MWNYRVIEFIDPEEGPWRAIHEVYYDAEGKPTSYAEGPTAVTTHDPDGNSAELGWVLDRMRDALKKPVLIERDFAEQQSEAPTASRINQEAP